MDENHFAEGLHVKVSGKHNSEDLPKKVLTRYLLGLGVAKEIAESGITQDVWANTRLEREQEVSVYGRVPKEKASWRRAVDTNNRNVQPVNNLSLYYDYEKLQRLSRSYLPNWETLADKMSLFENGVKGKDTVKPENWEDELIWENDKFNLVVVQKPHVKGLHLVIFPKEKYQRQWQTVLETTDDIEKGRMIQQYVQGTLEATAEQNSFVRSKVGNKQLTNWLEQNCKGLLTQ